MQKKIIALAVAGLASTAAFAQTNVTIYGSLDYGYSYRWDDQTAADRNGQSAFDGGIAQGNRLGFKGTEDLGNGLKAVFLVEQGLGLDSNSNNEGKDGVSNTGNKSINFTRQAYVGLSGNFGTLVGGRLYTPHFSLWSGSIDPFGAGTVGNYQNYLGGALAGDVVRVDNAVAYISPSFGGFSVTAAYSNNLAGQESTIQNGDDTPVYAVLGKFVAGGLDLGLNYHFAKFQGVNAVDNTYNVTLGGNYNFGFMKLHGAVAYNETEFQNVATENLEVYNYFVGLTVPVGKVDLKASYGYSDADQRGVANGFALGANYNLSKRTDLYTAYAWNDRDDDRIAAGALVVGTGVSDASNSGNAYGQGFQVGVRHKF